MILSQIETVLSGSSLSSLTGIIVFTSFSVQYIMNWASDISYLKKIPGSIFFLVMSMFFTFVANKVFHTLDGNLGYLLFQAANMALASSGIHQWVKNGTKGIEITHKPSNVPESPPEPSASPTVPTPPPPSKSFVDRNNLIYRVSPSDSL